MKAAWQRMAKRFDALKPRERVLVFIAGAAIIACIGFVSVVDGAMTRSKELAKAVEKQKTELGLLKSQIAELNRTLAANPDAEGRKRAEMLRKQLTGFDIELKGVQQGLVPPNRMVKLLEEMLGRDARVHLVKLRTLPVTALVEAPAASTQPAAGTAPAEQPKPAGSLVYKHGIELTIEGAYLDLLEYQSRLEKLPWKMFFARTSMDSTAYPKVYMTVTLYTLSLEQAWLVV
jgi:MSHA biogenesis protein MshJ